jgi:predicted nucleotidyltransferase component of viral defense system
LKVDEDGVEFDEASVTVTDIREDQQYGGFRVTMRGRLGNIRLPIQVDIGFGDAMTPEPKSAPFPVLLDAPAPMLRLYSKETVVAEKTEAMVQLGLVNSRMKDYYDLWVLMKEFEFDGDLLKAAIRATFNRRKTPLPTDVPQGLTDQFGEDPQKQSQWTAFLRRAHAKNPADNSFKSVIEEIRTFLLPPLLAAGLPDPFYGMWPKGGPWHS